MSIITWTPQPDNPNILIGEPGSYLIQIKRAANGTTGHSRGRIVGCRVLRWADDDVDGHATSIAKAKALAEQHAQEN